MHRHHLSAAAPRTTHKMAQSTTLRHSMTLHGQHATIASCHTQVSVTSELVSIKLFNFISEHTSHNIILPSLSWINWHRQLWTTRHLASCWSESRNHTDRAEWRVEVRDYEVPRYYRRIFHGVWYYWYRYRFSIIIRGFLWYLEACTFLHKLCRVAFRGCKPRWMSTEIPHFQ